MAYHLKNTSLSNEARNVFSFKIDCNKTLHVHFTLKCLVKLPSASAPLDINALVKSSSSLAFTNKVNLFHLVETFLSVFRSPSILSSHCCFRRLWLVSHRVQANLR